MEYVFYAPYGKMTGVQTIGTRIQNGLPEFKFIQDQDIVRSYSE